MCHSRFTNLKPLFVCAHNEQRQLHWNTARYTFECCMFYKFNLQNSIRRTQNVQISPAVSSIYSFLSWCLFCEKTNVWKLLQSLQKEKHFLLNCWFKAERSIHSPLDDVWDQIRCCIQSSVKQYESLTSSIEGQPKEHFVFLWFECHSFQFFVSCRLSFYVWLSTINSHIS